ncbi:MAG: PAS domain S-box protein, partial [Deltaproteobacteria bacterium]|nr:PAS domain S-box protein [Deltaproteobacteria bacterium]
MPKKPTYEELEQRVKKLKKEAIGCKQVEEELRRSEEKYKTLTTSSLTGIFIHQDGKYVFVNDRFAKVHGYATEELLGNKYKALIHPDYRDVIAERVSKRLRGESAP